jgi:hypothetical protein
LASLKEIAAKMLTIQERQEAALNTIAACLEKVAEALERRD